MYDILDLYEEDYDPKHPIICLDEKPKQLLGDKRMPIPMKPGRSEKYDYEYVRNGAVSVSYLTGTLNPNSSPKFQI